MCIKYINNWLDLEVPQAMKLINFSIKEVANLSLHCFIKQSLPGKMLKGLKAHVAGPLLLSPPLPDCTKRLHNCTIDDAGACSCAANVGACAQVIAVTHSPLLP